MTEEHKPTISVAVNETITNPVNINIEKSLIELSVPFNQQLRQIRSLVNSTKQLIGLDNEPFDINGLDEDALSQALTNLEGTTELYNQVTDTRKKIKSTLNDYTEAFMTQLDYVLTESGFNDLDLLKTESTRIKREILSNRKQQAWLSCYEVYQNALAPYPNVGAVFPKLLLFDGFERIVNQRALFKPSGAKSFKVTSTIQKSINNLALSLNDLATATITALQKLPEETHATILMTVTSSPTLDTLLKQVQYTEATLASKAKLEQQEAANKAALEAAQVNAGQQQAQVAQDPNMPSQQVVGLTGFNINIQSPIQDDGTFFISGKQWLQQSYIPKHGTEFYDIQTNPDTKLKLLKLMLTEMDDPTSEISGIMQGNSSAALTTLLAAMTI